MAVAAGGPPRIQEPQHRGRRQPHEERGRGVLLALRHRQKGHPGQPAAGADPLLPQDAERADPQPAHRRVQRGLHERVGQPGVPVPPQRRGQVPPPHPRPLPPVRLRPAGHEAGRTVHPPHLPASGDPVEAGGKGLRRGREDPDRFLQGGDRPVRHRRAEPPGPRDHPLLPQGRQAGGLPGPDAHEAAQITRKAGQPLSGLACSVLYPLYPLGLVDCHFQEEAHISSMPYLAAQPSSSLALAGSA